MKTPMLFAATAAAVALMSIIGCASSTADDAPWTTHFVGSPDDSWSAIKIALAELDYDVTSENRHNGRISAAREADGDRLAAALDIDQVMRTNVVHIYVRVSGGTDGPALERGQQESLAKEFLDIVNCLLYK